jgi:hypothetical protein
VKTIIGRLISVLTGADPIALGLQAVQGAILPVAGSVITSADGLAQGLNQVAPISSSGIPVPTGMVPVHPSLFGSFRSHRPRHQSGCLGIGASSYRVTSLSVSLQA